MGLFLDDLTLTQLQMEKRDTSNNSLQEIDDTVVILLLVDLFILTALMVIKFTAKLLKIHNVQNTHILHRNLLFNSTFI